MKKLIVLLLVILTSACANHNVVSSEVTWAPQGYSDQAIRDKVTEVNNVVNTLMTYETDITNHGVSDHWDDYVAEVEAGESFRDDCEDAAITKAKLLVKHKIVKAKDVRLVLVCSSKCQLNNKGAKYKSAYDHMVTVVRIGRYDYVMDIAMYRDTILAVNQTMYTFHSSMSMHEEGVWRVAKTVKVE
jgi:predicted transglutaminase-like cysteine proteinase